MEKKRLGRLEKEVCSSTEGQQRIFKEMQGMFAAMNAKLDKSQPIKFTKPGRILIATFKILEDETLEMGEATAEAPTHHTCLS